MTDSVNSQPAPRDSLVRGQFSDGRRFFTVRASSSDAPDSFQVFANGDHNETVLIVSGLTSGDLKATWGPGWNTASTEWKEWAEDSAFCVFYNQRIIERRSDTDRPVRQARPSRQIGQNLQIRSQRPNPTLPAPGYNPINPNPSSERFCDG